MNACVNQKLNKLHNTVLIALKTIRYTHMNHEIETVRDRDRDEAEEWEKGRMNQVSFR